jgi:hypothetical protein
VYLDAGHITLLSGPSASAKVLKTTNIEDFPTLPNLQKP